MDQIANNIQLTWKLVRMLKTYKTCNSMMRFSKYEFYDKLLDGAILFRVILNVTWTQLNYNRYKLLIFTKKIKVPHARAQRLVYI